jgi:hypothetical protein
VRLRLVFLNEGISGRQITARFLASIVTGIGGLTLLEHVFDLNFGIDTALFVRDWYYCGGPIASDAATFTHSKASLRWMTF